MRRFLAARAPSAAVRRQLGTESGFDPGLWRSFVHDLALPGVTIPETLGGQGLGFAEAALVAEELGRALTPSPFFASVILSGGVLRRMPAASRRDELWSRLAQGTVASLAWVEPGGDFSLDGIETAFDERRGTVTGDKTLVLDGTSATRLLVVTRGSEGALSLVVVDATATGVRRRALRTLDATRRLTAIELRNATAERIGEDVKAELEGALAEASIAQAAECVGGLGAVIESALAHAKTRRQFGRTVGSFQAIKHKLADLWILFEGARTAVEEGVAAVVRDADDLVPVASAVNAYATEAYRRAAFDHIQILGGSGFTWEVDAHLHLRRAQFAAAFLGAPTFHRERIARTLEELA